MSLSELYIDYLRAREYRSRPSLALINQLNESGYVLEGFLLNRYRDHGPGEAEVALPDHAWAGARAHLGPELPASARAGELWFDVCEVGAMVLVPNDPPEADWSAEARASWTALRAWLSLRPVAVWQYRAFLALAKIGRMEQQLAPPFPLLDGERIAGAGDETRHAARLTCAEAAFYSHWLGKSLANRYLWLAAAHQLPRAVERLWGSAKKEWEGWGNEEEAIAISPATFELDVADERDRADMPSVEQRMIYGEFDKSASFGFRTAVNIESGLFASITPSLSQVEDVYVTEPLAR